MLARKLRKLAKTNQDLIKQFGEVPDQPAIFFDWSIGEAVKLVQG